VIGANGAWGSIISGVEVIRDETGKSTLRNLSVNGVSVDKFPHA
jgi:hypothetical protein